MDSPAVTALLMEYHALQAKRPQILAGILQSFHNSLASRQQLLAERYFKDRLSEAVIAVQVGLPHATVVEELRLARKALKQTIEADGSLGLTFRAEPPLVQDTIIDDCFREGHANTALLVERYFGVTADLLCPRVWG